LCACVFGKRKQNTQSSKIPIKELAQKRLFLVFVRIKIVGREIRHTKEAFF